MRAILLTSTFLRHQFVINYLGVRVDLVGVWQEEKSFRPERYAQTDEDRQIIEEHFAARDASEEAYFSEHRELRLKPETVHRQLEPGQINDLQEAALMVDLAPDVVLVFGTGILKESIIAPFDGKIINIHLGVSPYYRGAGTNFWPLVNRQPEYVGATIHYIDAGIDTGPIIAHTRPEIEVGDGAHDIGNKTIQAAAAMLAEAALAHSRGGVESLLQNQHGKLYQRKDFNANAVKKLYHNFETGMIEEYLNNKTERDAKLELVSLETIE
ncbi:MAG: formyl transferase [Xenococcaceae cyanobacterium]